MVQVSDFAPSSPSRAGLAPSVGQESAPARAWVWLGVLSVLALLVYPLSVAWAGVVGQLVLAARRWRLTGRIFPASPLTVALALYLLGAALGLAETVRPAAAQVRFFGLVAALGAFALVLDSATSVSTADRLARGALYALLGLLLTSIAIAPLAMALVATQRGLAGPAAPLLHLLATWLQAGLELRDAIANFDGDVRFQRVRSDDEGLAMLGAAGWGLALGPLLVGPDRRSRLLGAFGAGFSVAVLLMVGNRSGLLAALTMAILFGGYRRPRLTAVTVLTLAIGLAVATQSGLLARAIAPERLDPSSLYERLEIWEGSLFIANDFRFTGVGLGLNSVRSIYQAYFPSYETAVVHSHNIILQSYLEQGLLGLAGMLGLLGSALAVGWRALGRLSEPRALATALSASGVALALALTGLTEVIALTTVGMVLLGVSLGVLVAVERTLQPPGDQGGRRTRGPAAVGLARTACTSLGLLVIAYISVQVLGGGSELARWKPTSPLAELYQNLGAHEVKQLMLGRPAGDEIRQQRQDSARAFLQQALSLDPSNPRILLDLAQAAIALGDRAQAVDLLSEASRSAAPGDSRLQYQLGRLYRQTGEVEAGLAAWSRVDRRLGRWNAADRDSQLVDWGQELVRAQRWPEAVKVNRAAVELAPLRSAPYAALTLALSRTLGGDSALATLEQLVSDRPEIPWAYMEVAELNRLAGRFDEALTWQRRADQARDGPAWGELQQKNESDRSALW